MDDMLKTYMPVSLTEWRRRNAVLVADSVFLSEESEVMDDDLRVEVGGWWWCSERVQVAGEGSRRSREWWWRWPGCCEE